MTSHAVGYKVDNMKKVISGAQAAAEAVKLCSPKVIAMYPITPQTHIVEGLAKFVADGELDAEIIRVESEQSAMSACIGAQATGVRAYTATASQGLALMHEMLFVASGMRLPIVMSVGNRSLSSPLSIWNDEQDSFSQRDTGWIQLYAEDAQETFDSHIQAFKIAEKVELPIMVCLDGFVLTHTYEPVHLIDKASVQKFIGKYIPNAILNPTKPATLGALATPDYYMEFKKQQQEAMEKAKEAIRTVNREFSSAFGRLYGNGLIEKASLDDKSYAIITIGSVTGTVRSVLEKENIGLIRVRSLRPFPKEEIVKACANLEGIAVLEKDISFGANGALYDEVRSALFGADNKPKVSGFIAGLGGRDIKVSDIENVAKKIKEGKEGVDWITSPANQ